jgi:cytochrome c peroxidase
LWLSACLVVGNAAAVTVTVRANEPEPVGAPVEFSATADGVGELTYTWNFGDGTSSEPSAAPTITHTYQQPGHYPVIVIVRDDIGSRSDSFVQTAHRELPETAAASSSTIVFDKPRSRVCNVNSDNDTVSCLSTDNLDLLFEVPVGKHPRSLSVAPDGTLWVANQEDATLSVLGPGGALQATVALPHASRPFGIVTSSTSAIAYVALQARGELAEIDTTSRQITRVVPAGPWATGVGIHPDGMRVFVTRFISGPETGEVVELDAASLAMTRTFVLSPDPGPDTEATARGVPNYLRAVVPSPDGAFLWVPAKQDNVYRGEARDGFSLNFETTVRTVARVVDLTENHELSERRVDMNNRSLGLSLAFSPIGDYAFVGLIGNNGFEVVDTYNGKIVGGGFDTGRAPDGVVLDDAGRLYMNAFLSRSVVVVDVAHVLDSTDFAVETIAEVVVSTAEKLAPEVLTGKQLFYDASDLRMSKDGYISCATCHLDGFEDGRVWDFTVVGEGLRNTVSLLGRRGTGHGNVNWSGNLDEVQDIEDNIRHLFGGEGFLSAEQLAGAPPLGASKAGLSAELDAIAAYVESLKSTPPSPFRNPDGTLTADGELGRTLFRRLGCGFCHGGPDTTDSAAGKLHDVGTSKATSGDRGGNPEGGIDTPTLNGIWQTAPYLHDGSAATLQDVLTTQNSNDLHGYTSVLNVQELGKLVSFLQQLDGTGDPEPPMVDVPLPEATAPPPDVVETDGCTTTPLGRTPWEGMIALMLSACWWARWRAP